MSLNIDLRFSETYLDSRALQSEIERGCRLCDEVLNDRKQDSLIKGWTRCDGVAVQMKEIAEKAAEIRSRAEVFVLVGVGGSNQAARALIEALPRNGGPEVLYAGNTLSARALRDLLGKLEGRSVYINVIAKNFETLEPGSHYRMLRMYMSRRYDRDEMARRVVLTGTRGSLLEDIARKNGCLFLEFPLDVGGRYSAFTPVGLLPIAAAGLDVGKYLEGVRAMENRLSKIDSDNIAVRYAAVRHSLFKQGFSVEVLSSFEPQFSYFNKWWWQLFGESEGKEGTGIFPAFAQYSEDLHSIGQYMQAGKRMLMETFLSVKNPAASLPVEKDPSLKDGFEYLDGWDFTDINRVAEKATIEAHHAGGVPCAKIEIDSLDEYHFGQLFYFFMLACAVSGKLNGINPFDQDGVEHYKRSMFRGLGKPN